MRIRNRKSISITPFAAGFVLMLGSAIAYAAALNELEALALCQSALKRISKDAEKAEVPYVANMGRGTEFYYAWGASTKMVRMRNGFGGEVATSASCIVDGTSGKIVSLTLSGKSIL